MMIGPHAGKTFGQRIGSQQHHGPGYVLGQRFADSHRVGADQVQLELANVLAGDAHVGEMTNTGIDRVGDPLVLHQIVDDGAGAFDGSAGFRLQQHRAALIHQLAHVFQSQVVAVDMKGLHKYSVYRAKPSRRLAESADDTFPAGACA